MLVLRMSRLAASLVACVSILGCASPPAGAPAARSNGAADPTSAATMLLASARTATRAGSLDAALSDAQKALGLREQSLGASHPGTHEAALVVAEVLEGQISVRMKSGDYMQATPMAGQVAAIRERAQGTGHRDHVRALLLEARLHRYLCQLALAESSAARAVALASKAPGGPQVPFALEELAAVKEAQGRDSDAASLLSRAISDYLPTDAGEARRKRDWILHLALLASRDKRSADAVLAAEQALALEETWNATEVTTAAQLAGYYHDAAKDPQALQLYLRYGLVEYAVPLKEGNPSAQLSPPEFLQSRLAGLARTGDKPTDQGCRPAGRGTVADVTTTVAGMREGFRGCYNAALSRDPSLAVALRLSATIDASGAVSRAWSVTRANVPGEMVTCALEVLRSKRFSPPEGGSATVVIPLTLVQKKD